jgi:hypothetical protein
MLFNVGNAVKLYVTSTNITSLLVKRNSNTRLNHIKRSKGQCFPNTKVSPDFHNFSIPKNRHVT